MDKEADKVIRELGDAWADVERWKKKAAEWERISDQMEHRLMQIADIVKHIKTADGFDPVCSNEIVAAVEKLRAENDRLTRECNEARAELAKGTVTITATVDPQGRLERFTASALTGLLANSRIKWSAASYACEAVIHAQATIRAIDDAGGWSSFAPSNEAPPR